MQKLGNLTSDRLGASRSMLIAAILRSYNAPLVPEDFTQEPVSGASVSLIVWYQEHMLRPEPDLVTRLLHQIHFIAEQTPLDSTTYALTTILMTRVVAQGGVGVESSQSEQAQEQLTLVVGIIGACCGECRSIVSLH